MAQLSIKTSISHQNNVIDNQLTVRLMAGKQNKIDSRRTQLIDIVRNNPRIELAELQRQLGLGSANTLKADIRFLTDTGQIEFENRTFAVKG
jgi:predicted transcriptional regulator